MDALTSIPESLIAGDSARIELSISAYPASAGWVLTFFVAGAHTFSKGATASGDVHVIALAPSDTENINPGSYRYALRVEKGPDAFTIERGAIQIEPNIATASAGDLQSWEEKTLAIVEAALAGRLSSGLESWQIAGRSVSKIPIPELMKIRNSLRASVGMQSANGQGFGQSVEFGFGSQNSILGSSPFGTGR